MKPVAAKAASRRPMNLEGEREEENYLGFIFDRVIGLRGDEKWKFWPEDKNDRNSYFIAFNF